MKCQPARSRSIELRSRSAVFSAGVRAKIGLMPTVNVKAVTTVAAHTKTHLVLFMCLFAKQIPAELFTSHLRSLEVFSKAGSLLNQSRVNCCCALRTIRGVTIRSFTRRVLCVAPFGI